MGGADHDEAGTGTGNGTGTEIGTETLAAAPLGFLLRQAAGAHRLQIDRALADLGVTAPQFLILTLLAQEAGLSNADLARRTALAMPTVSAMVQRLKAAGLVESRPHRIHGRIRNLYLTPQGRDRRLACDRRAQGIERDLTAAARPGDLKAIRTWLEAAAASLKAPATPPSAAPGPKRPSNP